MSGVKRQQGLVFGEVAELYDRIRPGYPEAAFEELAEKGGLAPGAAILEVGAGTGKATLSLTRRGWQVTALEPSSEMAAVLRRKLVGQDGVEVAEVTFEAWDGAGRRFSALLAAQAWHWVDPALGYPKAAELLRPGGILALLWNRPAGGDSGVRAELDAIYRRLAPELAAAPPGERQVDRAPEIERSGCFEPAAVHEFPWEHSYSQVEYQALMRTQSDHRLLPAPLLEQLLAEIGEVIARSGGWYRVSYVTLLYLSRART